ncbi:alginate lyase family protein [Nocardioides lentus]|uniref:Alginate lyase family protein n=1 Tax=Nocardioides lentus TaxID=338077 RepID=A0ABP5AMF5_9ACTN
MRLSTAVSDLRALGSSAPLRAAYELSKRSGGHTLLFREVPDRGARSRAIGLGSAVPRSDAARDRCLADAAEILASGVRVFGTRVPTGVHAPWNVDPLSGNVWPESTPWWQIDIRSGARLSDVKWVWEAGRHRDLVVLARASVLDPDGPWLDELHAMLRAWFAQCRPERGVHWYSSLELALRAISWAQVISLLDGEIDADVRARMDHQLVASARHILVELPYTVSSMKNNHLLGDGLGLVVLARMFPDFRGSRRWARIGDALLLKQLSRHMRDDGSMIEDSLSYHRFVMEMLLVRSLLGSVPAEVSRALHGAGRSMRDLGVLDGAVPQFGDWDEGRVLADSSPAGSVAGSTTAALVASGEALGGDHGRYDEVCWYLAPAETPTPAPVDRATPGGAHRRTGGFDVVQHGDWRVWVKTGTGPSHQHADVGSVWIRSRDRWVTEDPGTGTYNGPLNVRNGFRTSAAHPVWRPDGEDQLGPHRAFRWMRGFEPSRVVDEGPGRTTVLSVHAAFVGLGLGRVARVVEVSAEGVLVVDFVEQTGDGTTRWVMNVPRGAHAEGLDLDGVEVTGAKEPFRGWFSPTYGAWEPRPWSACVLDGSAFTWSAGRSRGAVESEGSVSADGRVFQISWREDGVVVDVTGSEDAQRLEIRGA